MSKLCFRITVCMLAALFAWFGMLLSDRERLNKELIRIHVVANSDSPEDQSLKLTVRDAVIKSIQSDLTNISDAGQARTYLQEKLPYIQNVARKTLETLGCQDPVAVTLQKESFDSRSNDLLSLPAGVYEALRITIGSGQGENWWSVIFPDVCQTVSEKGTEITTASGFPGSLEKSLSAEEFEIHFYLLDVLGNLENIFFHG